MLEYLESINCVQMNYFKMILPTNYWLSNHINNHLTICKQLSSGSFKNAIYKLCIYNSYMYEEDLALDNLQGLICHKTQLTR